MRPKMGETTRRLTFDPVSYAENFAKAVSGFVTSRAAHELKMTTSDDRE
jgi:hypothetical protein